MSVGSPFWFSLWLGEPLPPLKPHRQFSSTFLSLTALIGCTGRIDIVVLEVEVLILKVRRLVPPCRVLWKPSLKLSIPKGYFNCAMILKSIASGLSSRGRRCLQVPINYILGERGDEVAFHSFQLLGERKDEVSVPLLFFCSVKEKTK